jgi:hypothetical protein
MIVLPGIPATIHKLISQKKPFPNLAVKGGRNQSFLIAAFGPTPSFTT